MQVINRERIVIKAWIPLTFCLSLCLFRLVPGELKTDPMFRRAFPPKQNLLWRAEFIAKRLRRSSYGEASIFWRPRMSLDSIREV